MGLLTYAQIADKYGMNVKTLAKRIRSHGLSPTKTERVGNSGRKTMFFDEDDVGRVMSGESFGRRREKNEFNFTVEEYAVDGITDPAELRELIGHRVRFLGMRGDEQFGILKEFDGPVVTFDQNGMERVNLLFKSGIQRIGI